MEGRDTSTRIVEAARDLFGEKGYGSTTVAEILSRSQTNSGSLYYHFTGKQDVLIAVLESYRDGVEESLLQPAWSQIDDPIERIFSLLQFYRSLIVRTECTYSCPVGSLALELNDAGPIIRKKLAETFSAWVSAVRACLEAAGDRLAPGTDLQALAEFVLTTIEGALIQAQTHRDVAWFDRSVGQLRSHIHHQHAEISAQLRL